MESMVKNTRLFLAVRPCAEIYDAHRHLVAANSELSGTRWVRKDNLHLTVFFIGDIDADQSRHIKELLPALSAMIPKPIRLQSDRLSLEGGRINKPSMAWARFRVNYEFTDLNNLIRNRLKSWIPGQAIFKEPVPHVTLARIRSGPPPVLNLDLNCTMMLSGFELWETIRTSEGVTYRVVEKYFPEQS